MQQEALVSDSKRDAISYQYKPQAYLAPTSSFLCMQLWNHLVAKHKNLREKIRPPNVWQKTHLDHNCNDRF